MATRPTRPATKPVAYSHVAWLGMRAYESFESYWHGDGPRPKRRHACNPARDGNGYRALCGKRIVPGDAARGTAGAGDFFDADHGEASAVVPATQGGATVNCRGCRRKLGLR